jgi:hypothetical protein
MKALLLCLLCTPALAQVSISLQYEDQALIPGSVRSLYAKVEGTENLAVRWTTTGGCTLESPSTNAAPERVVAPAKGASCRLGNGNSPSEPFHASTNETPSFNSAVSCRVTATSAADSSKSASIVLPICAPEVRLITFPASTVLFKEQFGVIQSDLRGSVNTGVTWAITTNPGGAGKLTGGATNRHAVFSASAPGTYVLTATSNADPRQKASTSLVVTGNTMPSSNPDHTEPVDCTAVGKGKTFEVGPAHEFHDLNAVSWNALKPGDTVRIHNDDTTSASPTVYHQKIVIAATGTPTQPIRICGVPDAHGVKPILDGDNATSRKDVDWAHGALEDAGLILVYDGPHKFDTRLDNNQNILIEGLHLRNATSAYKFLRSSDGAPTAYNRSVSCVHLHTGSQLLVRGNELENCTQAVFTNSQTPIASVIQEVTLEGNSIRAWGTKGNEGVHGMYLQAMGLTVQFNYFGAPAPGASGNVIKDRSVLNFLRWNYISQDSSTARAFDLVEPQGFDCYVNPFKYAYYHSKSNNACLTPHDGAGSDPLSPDTLAANFEAYHSDYVYGNVFDDTGAGSAFVHYGYDQQIDEGARNNRRGGTLFYWNNTHIERVSRGAKVIFEPGTPESGHSYEFPVILSANNVFAANGETVYQWVRWFWAKVIVDSNWMKPDSMLPDRTSSDTYQGGTSEAERKTCSLYNRCKAANGHLEWGRNGRPGTEAATLYTGPIPFDPVSFRPSGKLKGLAAPLPVGVRDQPSNMEFFPATGLTSPRRDETFLGALD